YEDRAAAAGLGGQLGGINLVQTDYDNDGWLDLFVMRGGWQSPMRNSLLRNGRDGTFTDVTEKAGLMKTVHRTHSAAWADFDGDGWLDVFVGHEETPAALFRNQGDGTFVDVARAAGVARSSFIKGAAWGDYDGDGAPDLYVSNFAGPNFLYRNRGDGTFEEKASALGVDKPVMSFPAWFWDYDEDGRLDLFVASFVPSVTEVARGYLGLPAQAESMRLYRNTGGAFADVTRAAGLERVVPAMGANFGDLDEDGFLDFYLGTGAPSYAALVPNVMFRNRGDGTFVDVTTATGTGHLQKGHGVAFADLDDDGDQDVYANIGGFVPGDAYHKALFRNPGHGHRWLRVKLIGTRANRGAIGAKLAVTVVGEDGRERVRHREVGSGGSFGASPLEQHVGLGRAARVKSLEVEWPGRRLRQSFRDVPLDARIVVREGAARVERLSAPAKPTSPASRPRS
ncbi:MAG TPA: CRTAC1 family protein, partial [Vicinamibacteria bacterium]